MSVAIKSRSSRSRSLVAKFVVGAVLAAAPVAVTVAGPALPAAACTWQDQLEADQVRYVAELPQVRQGQHGMYVLTLQSALISNGYHLQGTGYYGTDTLAAVKDWQANHGITPSGLVGPKTWSSFRPGSGEAGHQIVRFSTVSPSIAPGDPFSRFEGTGLTRALSKYASGLNYLPYWTRPVTSTPATYTGINLMNIRQVQTRAGISPSGLVGPKTTKALELLVNFTHAYSC